MKPNWIFEMLEIIPVVRNRAGRKRKQGYRRSSGDLAKPAVNYTAMAAEQPHRACLPEKYREDTRAGTELGKLLLTGQLGAPNRDKTLSERAQALHEAGRRYAGVVSRYRSMIGSPRATGGAGKGYGCLGDEWCHPPSCECLKRTRDYNNAFAALSELGRVVLMIVNRVAVHDLPCPLDQVPVLKIGLGVLVREFGLKT